MIDLLCVYGRIQHITRLVNAQFLHDEVELLNDDIVDSIVNAVVRQHIVCLHFMLLTNTVYTTDALLQRHRIPGKVIVDDDVAELHVQ